MTPDTQALCSTGCGRPHYRDGYCLAHYMRVYRSGSPGPVEIRSKRAAGPRRPLCARRPCRAQSAPDHAVCYQHGAPLPPMVPGRVKRVCSVAGCTYRHSAKGYCRIHYDRVSTWGSTDLRYRSSKYGVPARPERRCGVSGCSRKHHAQGHCLKHYERARRRGSVGELLRMNQPEAPTRTQIKTAREIAAETAVETEMDRRALEWLRTRSEPTVDVWARQSGTFDEL